jgi:uncharacterized protein YdeI (YjbR/CyaY-like superfamily)
VTEQRIHAETREQWRAWLAAHAAEGRGVWLVTWKQASGRPVLTYEDAVTEALAFGWIDSAFAASTTRRPAVLEWLVQARTAPTRAQRIAENAEKAGRGERAHQRRPGG